MHINLIKLKIKIKHLALEPAIIRKEEQKRKKMSRWSRARQEVGDASRLMGERITLRNHRQFDVRNEARATQLAYAFLRGKEYLTTEANNPVYNDSPNCKSSKRNYWFNNSHIKTRAIKIAHKYRFGIDSYKLSEEDTRNEFERWLGIE